MRIDFNELQFDENDGVKYCYLLTNGEELYDSSPSYKILISNFADNYYYLPQNLAIYKLVVDNGTGTISVEHIDGKEFSDFSVVDTGE